METNFTGVPTSHLSLGSKDVLGIIKLFTLWNVEKPLEMVHRAFNDAELGVLQQNPVELSQPVCRHVRCKGSMACVGGLVGEGWGAEDGEVDRGE